MHPVGSASLRVAEAFAAGAAQQVTVSQAIFVRSAAQRCKSKLLLRCFSSASSLQAEKRQKREARKS